MSDSEKSNNKKLVPALRFKGFTGNWEQRKFSELFVKNSEKNNEQFDKTKTISLANMFFNVEGNGGSNESLKNYTVLRIGDVAFEGHSSKQYSYGRFVMNDIGDGIMSPRFTSLRPTFKPVILFWKNYIHSEFSMKRILVRSTKAGTMMNELVVEDLMKETLIVPSINEQHTIGEFFKTLDDLIAAHERKLSLLKQKKTYYLQQLFTQKLRFKGFTEPWKEQTLANLINIFDNFRVPVTAEKRISGETPYYGANGIQDYIKGYTHKGEFVLIAEDGASDLYNYPTFFVAGTIWVNNHAHVLQGRDKILNNQYLAYALEQYNFIPLLTGGTRVKLNAKTLLGITLLFPSYEEQQQISKLLVYSDNLITSQQKQLNLLKQTKQYYLQQLFV